MELLFEIGCEEIPAPFVPPALKALADLFQKEAKDAQLPVQKIRTLGTPRRLVLVAEGLPARQADRYEEKLGPAVKSAFDASGQPTKALVGFAKSQGVEVEQLGRSSVQKGGQAVEYFQFTRTIPGRETRDLLSEILTGLIPRLPFKKTMRWGATQSRFARPIHWIVALLDGQVVPVSFAEAGTAEYIESGNETRGHRFHAPGRFAVQNFAEYAEKLRAAFVEVDPGARKDLIRAGLLALAAQEGGRLIEDEALLEQVTWLVEHPAPLVGGFDEALLVIPREVLITSMRNHQRFFALEHPQTKALLPRFLTVAGTVSHKPETVRAGNERVLRARLADADFFFHEDQKKRLDDHGAGLSQVTYQAKLGSYAQKVARVSALVVPLCEVVAPGKAQVRSDALRAASLCKCDLLTGMVGEFPELQGVMGREYAKRQGERAEVFSAIEEHYYPRGESDELPSSEAGAVVALADKLDSVISLFAIGEKPKGEGDPYGVRRHSLGILRLVIGRGLSLDLASIAQQVLSLLQAEGVKLAAAPSAIVEDLGRFFRERLRGFLEKEKLRPDVINGVLDLGFSDALDNVQRAKALDAFTRDERFENFCDLAKRVRKIILKEKASERHIRAEGGFAYPNLGTVDPKIFTVPAESVLFASFSAANEAVPAALGQKNFAEAIERLASLIGPVDEFMNRGPKVLDDDAALRNNRVTLCGQLDRLISSVADFEKVQAKREA